MRVARFRELIKPQWLEVIERIKQAGSQPVKGIRDALGGSYMSTKTHCEELVKRGYLARTRAACGNPGRPMVGYSLTAKAELLFTPSDFRLAFDLLAESRHLFGEMAPERLIHQWFQKKSQQWARSLGDTADPAARAEQLAKLRSSEGWTCTFDGETRRLVDHHHPLAELYSGNERMAVIELRALEDLLGVKLKRGEIFTGRESMPKIQYEFR